MNYCIGNAYLIHKVMIMLCYVMLCYAVFDPYGGSESMVFTIPEGAFTAGCSFFYVKTRSKNLWN